MSSPSQVTSWQPMAYPLLTSWLLLGTMILPRLYPEAYYYGCSQAMPIFTDVTLLDSYLDSYSFLSSAYCPIYLSLSSSTKQTLLSLVHNSQHTTRQTTIDHCTLSSSRNNFTYWLLLSHTHNMIWLSTCIKIIAMKLQFYFNVKVQTLPKIASHGFDNLCLFLLSYLLATQPQSLRVGAW